MTSFLCGNMHLMKATGSYTDIKQQRWYTRVDSQGTIHVCLCQLQTSYWSSEETSPKAQNTGHQWPDKWTWVQQNLRKIKTLVAECLWSRPLAILACSHSPAWSRISPMTVGSHRSTWFDIPCKAIAWWVVSDPSITKSDGFTPWKQCI